MLAMDNCLTDCTQLSEKLILLAVLIFIFKLLPLKLVCTFVRQVAYILQTIRISLVLAGILPFVLHKQLTSIHPGLDYNANPHLIVLSLITNIAVAMGLRFIMKKKQKSSQATGGTQAVVTRAKKRESGWVWGFPQVDR